MRRVGLSDLDKAARVLLRAPVANRPALAQQLIAEADVSDRWRKRFGRAHPSGGTGSLFAQASLYPAASSSDCDASYCAALGEVLAALDRWRDRTHHDL